MSDPNRMTRTKYAEYKGVSKPMVSKWLSDNRLILSDCGKYIMVRESDARIKLTASLNNSFYDQKAGAEREAINKDIEDKGIKELSQEVSYQQLDLETEDAETLFRNARALKEKAAALQAAAEHEQFIGALASKDHIEKIVIGRGLQFCDGLLAVSRRIAPEIAGNNDIKQIESILDKEFRKVLVEFSKLPVIE